MGAMPAASPKTLKDLDWQRLVEALNGCRRLAKASDEPIPLAADAEEARAWLGELGEAMRTAEAGEPLPLGELRDLRPHLDRIAR
ncbi:MAG: hypothetical protein OEY14_18335, partial [Myxococcales bacterium]|nr:hypothetical protein [Myxococcales bacterium]